jgi:hypothetical protein
VEQTTILLHGKHLELFQFSLFLEESVITELGQMCHMYVLKVLMEYVKISSLYPPQKFKNKSVNETKSTFQK